MSPNTPSIAISRRVLLSALGSVSIGRVADASSGGSAHTVQAAGTSARRPSAQSPLFADAPHKELGEAAALYAGLIGSWDVDAIDYAADGTRRTTPGEWHFGWALEGRAVQDVLIVPGRADRMRAGVSRQGNRYGTTVRFYDPTRDAWRIVWVNPVNGSLNTLIARKDGEAIVHEGADDKGIRLRWTFVTITRDRFRWLGEFSADNGVTWHTQAEFLGRR